jgi:hypothetical protein
VRRTAEISIAIIRSLDPRNSIACAAFFARRVKIGNLHIF